MKHFINFKLFLLLAVALTFAGFKQNKNTVYLCDSRYATKYHYTPDCIGLEKCTHEIIKVPKDSAIAWGYDLCGFEK